MDAPRRTNDARPTVIVGTAPPLEDILSGASTEAPFDLESFMSYAKKHLFVENLVFLVEVDNLQHVRDPRKFESDLRRITNEFINQNSPSQVNLGDRMRKETEKDAEAVFEALRQDPSVIPNRTVLDKAYKEILSLVWADKYVKYTDHIVVQRQLRVSRLEALWWKEEQFTLARFFTFPAPVNAAESRLHACIASFLVVAASALSLVRGFHWIWVYMAYGYAARTLCGPRLDPQAFFILFVLRPLVSDKLGLIKNKFKAGSPRRFAQAVGLTFTLTATVLAFLKVYVGMVVVAAMLFGASFLAGFCDFCFACEFFLLAARANMVPLSMCEDCQVRYIKGKGTPKSEASTRKNCPRPLSNSEASENASKNLENDESSRKAGLWITRAAFDLDTPATAVGEDRDACSYSPVPGSLPQV